MTVKIIKTEPDPKVVKEVVCGHCGVTLQYVPKDVKDYKSYDYTGDYDTVYYIECPACNAKVTVKRY